MVYSLVDTYPLFRKYWNRARIRSIDDQIELWEKDYMGNYPELLKLQIENYRNLGIDWRKVAKERVFPELNDLLPYIEEAWQNLRGIIPETFEKFIKFWGRDFDVVFVLYVGIGCGAGWASEYNGRYAVLHGLENIAELKWHKPEALERLVLHELSHIAHMVFQGTSPREFEELEADPFFLLYSEGFATRCEHLIIGKETWLIAPDSTWLKWCKSNIAFLASEYLRRAEEKRPVNEFFGSWLNIEGKSQTGYYLGHEFIKYLENQMNPKEIATMNSRDIRIYAKKFLENLISNQ
jgi:hypothetical protein